MAEDLGGQRRKLDAKGRLSLPSALAKQLPDDQRGFKVTTSPDGSCLYIFESEKFKEWVHSLFEKQGGYSTSNTAHTKMLSVLMSRGLYVERDNADRIGLSADQRKVVGIDTDVVVFESLDWIEVWDVKRWEAHRNSIDILSLFD